MKIFIVEDDPLFARKFQFEIESTRVHDVYLFETAERAVGQLSTLLPDIVFVDHFLNGINGTDTIEIIKEKLPNCKIVSVSAQTDIRVFEQAIRAGACKYIIKDDDFPQNLSKFFHSIVKDEKVETTLEKLSKFFNKTKKREKPLVYLVDDDEVFNFLVQFKIETLKNCQLEIFNNGTKAINEATNFPDLLILDVNLKKMNGSTVLERYKELSPETKVIMVSSQNDLKTAVSLMNQGASDYVIKGGKVIEKLTEAINKALK